MTDNFGKDFITELLEDVKNFKCGTLRYKYPKDRFI